MAGKLLFLLLFLPLIACQVKQVRPVTQHSDRRHLGRWEGWDDSGLRGELKLYANGFVAFTVGGRSFGGNTLTKKGGFLYRMDYSTNPIHLDLIGVDKNYGQHLHIKLIVHFLSRQSMKICTFMNDTRPEQCESGDKAYDITLYKK